MPIEHLQSVYSFPDARTDSLSDLTFRALKTSLTGKDVVGCKCRGLSWPAPLNHHRWFPLGHEREQHGWARTRRETLSVLPQAFFANITRVTRKYTRSDKNHMHWSFYVLHRPSPENLNNTCKFFKIDYVKAWKILGRKPLIVFQEIETTTLTNILDHST